MFWKLCLGEFGMFDLLTTMIRDGGPEQIELGISSWMKVFFTVKCISPNSSKNFGITILKFSLREVLIVGNDVHL